jgi:3-carboxy-cis,cis-muconate cycloisomerase
LKAALWAHSLERCRRRLAAAADLGLTIQLAGAIGTGQQFGTKWSALQDEIGRALGLRAPDGGSWQSGRDEWVDLLMQMAMATGVATKIAGDIALMNQAEVAEVSEPPVAGSTSSVLPHKQNPVLAMRIRASGLVVSGHAAAALQSLGAVEHERGLGAWQAELALAPALVAHALSALQALVSLLEGLRFHADRAHANVERLGGLIFADRALSEIAALVPGAEARAIVERACRETRESGEHLRAVLARDLADGGANRPTRDEVDAALERAFDPAPAIDTAVRAAGRALPEAT